MTDWFTVDESSSDPSRVNGHSDYGNHAASTSASGGNRVNLLVSSSSSNASSIPASPKRPTNGISSHHHSTGINFSKFQNKSIAVSHNNCFLKIKTEFWYSIVQLLSFVYSCKAVGIFGRAPHGFPETPEGSYGSDAAPRFEHPRGAASLSS